ncbi:MAG: hypothetical protein U1A78_20390 [Polyangia bacterium]
MDEGLRSLSSLLGRVGAFFDIFDLSFFVSGAVSVGAISLIGYSAGFREPPLTGTWLVVCVVLTSYVTGLLCFSLGRMIRRGAMRVRHRQSFARRFHRLLSESLRAHGLDEVALAPPPHGTPSEIAPLWERRLRHYDAPEGGPGEGAAFFKYTLLWTKLRQSPHLAPSLVLLNRYWVMTAMFDGMTVALLLWALSLVLWGLLSGVILGSVGAAAALLGSILCLREADRFMCTQIDELCATVAWDRTERPAAPVPSVNIQVKSPGVE